MIDFKYEIQKVKLTDLKPAAYNPRVIAKDAYEGLGNSLNRFGLLSLIIWNKRTGNIVGGHQRYKQLVEMGVTETDVVVVNLDDNDEVALNISLNNPAMRGDFTKEVIDLLRKSEVQIGNAFNDLGLDDLFNYLRRIKFDDAPKKEEKRKQESEEFNNDFFNEGPDAVICCPRCRSLWKMENDKVIFNNSKGVKNDD
jgi:hypothetical protein